MEKHTIFAVECEMRDRLIPLKDCEKCCYNNKLDKYMVDCVFDKEEYKNEIINQYKNYYKNNIRSDAHG